MNRYMSLFVIGLILGLAFLSTHKAEATKPAIYKTICHHTPGNDVTLEFLNEQSYDGHLGTPHSESTHDTDGACQEPEETPTEEPTPTETQCIPTDVAYVLSRDEEYCEPTPTPSPTETVTPTPSVVTPTPSAPPPPHVHVSDGKSDGRSSCPECTKAPAVPKGAPNTGRGGK